MGGHTPKMLPRSDNYGTRSSRARHGGPAGEQRGSSRESLCKNSHLHSTQGIPAEGSSTFALGPAQITMLSPTYAAPMAWVLLRADTNTGVLELVGGTNLQSGHATRSIISECAQNSRTVT